MDALKALYPDSLELLGSPTRRAWSSQNLSGTFKARGTRCPSRT